MTEPTNHELTKQIAVLEERMNTHQAKYESAIDRLRADMAQRETQRDADAAKRDTDAAKRENRIMFAVVGTVIGAVAAGTAILGLMIQLSGS